MQVKSEYHTVVLGMGPAALQLAYLLARRKRDYIVLGAGPNFCEPHPVPYELETLTRRNRLQSRPDIRVERIHRRPGGGFALRVSGGGLIRTRVLVCASSDIDSDSGGFFSDSCKPDFDAGGPLLSSSLESVTCRHLFFPGPTEAAGRALFHILEQRYHGAPGPQPSTTLDARALLDALREPLVCGVFQSMMRAAGIGSPPLEAEKPRCVVGFFAPHAGEIRVSEDVRIELAIRVSRQFGGDCVLLEGQKCSLGGSGLVVSAHPVLRYYRVGALVSELHIVDNLVGFDWNEETYLRPILRFLEEVLANIKPRIPGPSSACLLRGGA